ncbi:MAG: sigma-E processing peptidase SpoIIGA [Lachnospiraceae bacterium]
MHYEIYPDTLFLENLLCNLLFLGIVKRCLVHAVTWKECIFAAVLTAAVNTVGSILCFRHFWILQSGILFPVSGMMVCYCMQIREWRRILYMIVQFAGLGLILGGLIEFAEQWTELRMYIVLLVLLFFGITAGIMERLIKHYRRQDASMRKVVIYLNRKCSSIRGFADTGNQLIDPVSKKPVCILEYDALEKILTTRQKYEITELLDFGMPLEPENYRYHYIPFQSLGTGNGMVLGMELDCMTVLNAGQIRVIEKPMIGITRQKFAGLFHYSILLHNDYC